MTSLTSGSRPTLSSMMVKVRTASDLQAFLKRQLPPYMVPSAFEIVERFPLTPAGKIDRKALQKIPGRRQELTRSHVPPRTATEQAVAEIWRDVLGVDNVGAQRRFL